METTKIIEAYLDGSLSAEDRIALESRLACDAHFASLVRLHKEANESIRDWELPALRKILKELAISGDYADTKAQNPKQVAAGVVHMRTFIRVAASFVLIALVGITFYWFATSKPLGEKLYEGYYQPYDAGMVDRAADSEISLLAEAMMRYDIGLYPQAYTLLQEILENEPDNYQAMFFLGLTCLELQKTDQTISALSDIPLKWNNPYVVHRDWYLALAYLKKSRNEDALALLVKIQQSQSFYSGKADEIIRKLRN